MKEKGEGVWQQSGSLHENKASAFCPWLKMVKLFSRKGKGERNGIRWCRAVDANKIDLELKCVNFLLGPRVIILG